MKPLLTLILLFIFSISIHAQSNDEPYDKALADSLGADDYGMKQYVFVLLKTGANKMDDKQRSDSLFRGHMENLSRLANAGKLVVAGPFKRNDKSYRGIFILNVKTIEEANELLSTDPAIKEKLLQAELFTWYGSAALPLYLKSHSKIEKNKP